jgi:hypothetical protein
VLGDVDMQWIEHTCAEPLELVLRQMNLEAFEGGGSTPPFEALCPNN